MVSAVSGAVSRSLTRSRPAASASTPTPRPAGEWKFTKVPDHSAEKLGEINRASALPAYVSICRLIDQQGFRGRASRRKGERPDQWKARTEAVRRAAKEENIIGVGLHAIARDSGLDIKTIRRQVKRLHALGAIVVIHRGLVRSADPATGRITENRVGRTPAALVHLTVTPDQLRPSTKAEAALRVAECTQPDTAGGAEWDQRGADDRGQNAPPSSDCPQTPTDTTTPTAAEDASTNGLTAEGAGRHSPAGAGGLSAAILGEGTTVTVDPSRKGIAVSEVTRTPAGGTASRSSTPPSGPAQPLRLVSPPADRDRVQSPTPDRSTRSPWAAREAEGAAPPEPWQGPAGDALRRQREAYERDRLAYERENPPVDRRAARKAAAEANLIEAVAGLPAASVDACRGLGRQIEAEAACTPDPAAKAESEALKALIERKRAEAAGVRRQSAKATKAAMREAYATENATA